MTTPTSGDGQSTSVFAAATAAADAVVRQTVAGDDGPAGRFAGQLAEVVQVVDASAVAAQQLAGLDGPLGPGSTARSLEVVADASGSTALDQSILQLGSVAGAGALEQWAGQQAELGQGVGAAAEGRQELAGATTGSGVVRADAAAVADHVQTVVQHGLVRDGLLTQWAGQLAQVVQLADAVAETIQVVRETGSGAARGRSVATDLAVGRQAVVQQAARNDGTGSQTAAQSAQVGQIAAALSVTSQTVSTTGGAVASSDAAAGNRSLVLQVGAQSMNGAAALDLQQLVQEAGRNADGARVVPLGRRDRRDRTDEQLLDGAAGRRTGNRGAGRDGGRRPARLLRAGRGTRDGRGRGGSAPRRPGAAPHDTARVAGTACGSRRGACAGARLPSGSAGPQSRAGSITSASSGHAPAAAPGRAARPSHGFASVPPQARLDTRPEGFAGRKAVDRESPLPPTDDPPTSGLGARTGRGVRRRRGDRSDPLRLRAHATAPAPRARRSGRQATALRARSDRRPRLTSPRLRGPAGQARQATSVRM